MIFGTHAFIEKQQWFWTLDKFKKKNLIIYGILKPKWCQKFIKTKGTNLRLGTLVVRSYCISESRIITTAVNASVTYISPSQNSNKKNTSNTLFSYTDTTNFPSGCQIKSSFANSPILLSWTQKSILWF